MAMIGRCHRLVFLVSRRYSSALGDYAKEGAPLSQLPPEERPAKVLYKGRIYYLKPRPGKTHFQEEFTMEDIEYFLKHDHIDMYGQPKYRKLKNWFTTDPEYEKMHIKAWQFCAQQNEGVKPIYLLGNKDLFLWNTAKIFVIINCFLIIHHIFWLVVPPGDNPFIWHGDENKYMGLKDWFLGRKMKTTVPE